nr:hypothetical protein CFP56_37330 [Quercus suber]
MDESSVSPHDLTLASVGTARWWVSSSSIKCCAQNRSCERSSIIRAVIGSHCQQGDTCMLHAPQGTHHSCHELTVEQALGSIGETISKARTNADMQLSREPCRALCLADWTTVRRRKCSRTELYVLRANSLQLGDSDFVRVCVVRSLGDELAMLGQNTGHRRTRDLPGLPMGEAARILQAQEIFTFLNLCKQQLGYCTGNLQPLPATLPTSSLPRTQAHPPRRLVVPRNPSSDHTAYYRMRTLLGIKYSKSLPPELSWSRLIIDLDIWPPPRLIPAASWYRQIRTPVSGAPTRCRTSMCGGYLDGS